MRVVRVPERLALEAQARAKGVYLTVSDAVRTADARRLEQMRALGTVTRAAAEAQTVHMGKAASDAAKWGGKIAEAEKRVADATLAAGQARRRFDFMSTVENHAALTRALQQEAAATAALSRVQAGADTSAARWAARGEKLGATWSVKVAKAEQAASAAAQGAIMLRAREIQAMEEAAGKGLAAAAIRDGESAAVVRYMRLIDLETAAKGRSAAATARWGVVSQAAARAGSLMKSAWGFVGGLPGAITAAVLATGAIAFAVSRVKQAMDPLTRAERARATSIDEYIRQMTVETATPKEQQVEKESEALKNLREQRELLRTLQTRRENAQYDPRHRGDFPTPSGWLPFFSTSNNYYDTEIETQKKRVAELEKLFQQTQSAAPAAAQRARDERAARVDSERMQLDREMLKTMQSIDSKLTRPTPGGNGVPSSAPGI
jgi:uncharacterized glyoxalase superfamily protein PhnB